MTATAEQREHATAGEPMTSAQRRALFAAGRRRGLDIDGLRLLTPHGSISALSRAEAARLLTSLNRGTAHEHPRRSPRRPRRPAGVYAFASDAQHRKIDALRIDLDWTPERLQEWLSGRRHGDGRPMTSIDSSADGVAVIELLKVVLSRTATPGNGDHSSTTEDGNHSGAQGDGDHSSTTDDGTHLGIQGPVRGAADPAPPA